MNRFLIILRLPYHIKLSPTVPMISSFRDHVRRRLAGTIMWLGPTQFVAPIGSPLKKGNMNTTFYTTIVPKIVPQLPDHEIRISVSPFLSHEPPPYPRLSIQ